MSKPRHCPSLVISAPASGQGKTTLTAALARHHRNRGRLVRVFKIGPDFLDPMILERASGQPVYQLDLYMGGAAHCAELLYRAAADADVILVEGVMGLFDGTPSTADVAKAFDLSVLAVIDTAAMAQTFAAIAHGLATYRADLRFAGAFANHVAGKAHAEMLAEATSIAAPLLGFLQRDEAVRLPDRHLGLVQAEELADLDQRLDAAAAALESSAIARLPERTEFQVGAEDASPASLAGVRIAIARDAAFAFIYHANLEVLRALGASLYFFSPLTDTTLPETESLYLPGGYPELHLKTLENNHAMQAAIRAHYDAGKPLIAECGGMLYLLDALTDTEGKRAAMLGILPGEAVVQKRLVNLGLQRVELAEGTLRGHTFHHSQVAVHLKPVSRSVDARRGGVGEPVYRDKGLYATYMHSYFPSNPRAVAALFRPR